MKNREIKPPSFRKAALSDAKAIASFNHAMAWETEQLDLDAARLQQGVESLICRPELGFYLVAENDGRTIGQLMITYEWSDWRNGIFWWVQSVYVHPDFRNQGVFAGLLREAEKRSQSTMNVCGFRLYVEESNRSAQEIYLHLGFQTTTYRMLEKDYVLHRSE